MTTAPANPSRFHLVQVSYDESIFQPDAKSDMVQRQIQYRAELTRNCTNAHITILALTYNPAASSFQKDGVTFLPVAYRRRFQIPGLVWKTLASLHQRDPIHVVTTQSVQEDGLGALIFRKFRGVPVVGQIHIDIFHPAARKENFGSAPWRWAMNLIVFWCLGKFDGLRVVGSRIRKQLKERGIPGPIFLVPVAMPLMAKSWDQSIVPEHKVVFVGRLEEQKRLDIWLKVAAEVAKVDPEVRFEIAGVGSQREDLESQAKVLGLQSRLRFLGLVPYENLPALYASSKVFLLTSSYEGFGRVVAEAMHFNVSMVGYRITGVEDIVEEGKTGYLHPFGDIEDTAASVLRLLQDNSHRKIIGNAGRLSVDKAFHPDRLAREWMDLLYDTGRLAIASRQEF
jgi:glycosyltransferase involved in cell wall biosynthesis